MPTFPIPIDQNVIGLKVKRSLFLSSVLSPGLISAGEFYGTVIAADAAAIVCRIVVDQPRDMKYSRETGLDIEMPSDGDVDQIDFIDRFPWE